jgi:hypothetical protein
LRHRRSAVFWAVLAMCAGARPLQAQVSLEGMTGSAYNVPTPLTIHQDGYPDIQLTARYQTKPFGPFAPYYSMRVSFWSGRQAWEFQQVHHRLFLANTTAEVQAFAIHYGYNYFLIGHAWRTAPFILHVSGGIVVANPSSTIRGKSLNTPNPGALDVGYRLSGFGAEVAVSRQVNVVKHLYVLVDGAVLMGWASVPVVGGSARVPNVGLHGHVGLGVSF